MFRAVQKSCAWLCISFITWSTTINNVQVLSWDDPKVMQFRLKVLHYKNIPLTYTIHLGFYITFYFTAQLKSRSGQQVITKPTSNIVIRVWKSYSQLDWHRKLTAKQDDFLAKLSAVYTKIHPPKLKVKSMKNMWLLPIKH